MIAEVLFLLVRAIHLLLESYVVIASVFVLLPLLLYPFIARLVRNEMTLNSGLQTSKTSFVIVTPAHNEESCIEGLVLSLKNQKYPKNKYRHIVIADNCDDATATRALKSGAELLERETDAPSDKTQALRFASDMLIQEAGDEEYIIVIDADCTVPDYFLSAVSQAIESKPAGAYQTYRRVSNACSGALPAMDAAAEELRQVINLGVKEVLGFDAHLHGNGTVYRTDLFHACAHARQEPFADDKAWKATITSVGERVKWIGSAPIEYAAVTEGKNFQNQRKRWITGQVEMIRTYAMPMIWLGLKRWDKSPIEFGLSMLQLPRAFLLLGAAYLFAISLLAPSVVTGHALFYLGLGISLFGYGLVGYYLGGIPLHPKTLLSTGLRTIAGVATSTISVILGNKTSSWAALRR